jgi:Mg2+/citrate symporter
MSNKESAQLTNAELEYRIKINENSNPKKLLEDIKELSKRSDEKERKSKRIIFTTLILTIVIVTLTIWSTVSPFFLKSSKVNISIDDNTQASENSNTTNTIDN